MPEPRRVAVVLRAMGAGDETALQGLRTALSLSLGDRPADLYILGEARGLLAAPPNSEMGRCLTTLRDELHVTIQAEGDGWDRPNLLHRIAATGFQQVF